MGRFAEIYTAEQRDALAKWAITNDQTARAAITAAEAGQLGLAPFTMPLKTAQHYIREERRRLALARLPNVARLPLNEGISALSARLLGIADRQVRALERQGRNAPPEQAIRVARLLAELSKLDASKRAPAPTAPRPAPTTRPTTTGFLAGLAQDLADETPHSTDHPTPQGEDGHATTAGAAAAHTTATTTDTANTGVTERPSGLARAGIGG